MKWSIGDTVFVMVVSAWVYVLICVPLARVAIAKIKEMFR